MSKDKLVENVFNGFPNWHDEVKRYLKEIINVLFVIIVYNFYKYEARKGNKKFQLVIM